jgi:hypothetical protein
MARDGFILVFLRKDRLPVPCDHDGIIIEDIPMA